MRNVAETAHRRAVFPPHDDGRGTEIPAPETAALGGHAVRSHVLIIVVRVWRSGQTVRRDEKRRIRRNDLFAPVQVLHQTYTVYVHTIAVIFAAQEKGLALCFVYDHKRLPKKHSGI